MKITRRDFLKTTALTSLYLLVLVEQLMQMLEQRKT